MSDVIYRYERSNSSAIVFAETSPFWITNISDQSSNTIEISETQSAGQIGSTLTSMAVQPKTLTITGVIMSKARENRAALLACIAPCKMARLTCSQNGTEYYLEGTPKKTPEIADGDIAVDFQFAFHVPYPFWRSVQNTSSQIAGLTPLFRFPFFTGGIWQISQFSESLFATVANNGDIPIGFDLIFNAVTEVQNPQLYHVEQGSYLKINKTLAAGEKMHISTAYGRKGAIYEHTDGSRENGFRFLDPASDLNITLSPGTNTLRYTADNNRAGMRVIITAPKGVLSGV